jgi:predicted small metal-binding protein
MSTELGTRKYIDCREFDYYSGCSLRISGTEDEVIAAAVEHAVSSHGYSGGEELRMVLRVALRSDPWTLM